MSTEKDKSLDRYNRIRNFVLMIITDIVNIYGFIKYKWDEKLINLIVYGLLFLGIPAIVYYLFFSTKKTRLLPYSHQPRFRSIYKFRWFALVMCILFILGVWYKLLYTPNKILEDKVVVLVTNFDGPDKQKYRITEQLLLKLHESLDKFSDTRILSNTESVSETQGTTHARALGEKEHADLVIWGYYGVTSSDVMITIHVENLTEITNKEAQVKNLYQLQAPIAEIDNFHIQQKLSNQLTAYTLFMTGLVRYLANDYSEAINRFVRVTQIENWKLNFSNAVIPYFYIGNSYLEQNKYSDALEAFNAAFLIDPINTNILLNRGFTFLFLHKKDEALSDINLLIRLRPYYKAYYARGYIYLELSQDSSKYYLNAIDDFTKVINEKPDYSLAYNNRGSAYLNLGQLEKAKNDFDNAIRLSPTNTRIYVNFGLIYAHKNDHRKAIEYYSLALQNDSMDTLIFANRSKSYFYIGEYDLAIKDCLTAIKYDSTNSNIYVNLGLSLLMENIFSEANANFQKALMYDANNYLAYHGLGLLQVKMGGMDNMHLLKGIQYFSKTIELKKDFVDAYTNRGNAYFGLGQIDLALNDYDKAISLDPTNPDVYNNRGLTYQALKKHHAAITDFTIAIRLNPTDARFYIERAESNASLGNNSEAMIDLKKASQLCTDLNTQQEIEDRIHNIISKK
jgi:tetratricopeptide (TPR) repeat protein